VDIIAEYLKPKEEVIEIHPVTGAQMIAKVKAYQE
jgi:hypothetical protein